MVLALASDTPPLFAGSGVPGLPPMRAAETSVLEPVPAIAPARVLIVDDQEMNVRLLTMLLTNSGYTHVYSTTDARDAAALFDAASPDIVLLDLHMPHLDGIAVLTQLLGRVPAGTYLPVLMMTGDGSEDAKRRALSMGARDFLTKPFSSSEALLRIRNLLETRFLHLQLQGHATHLEETVRERTTDLELAYVEAIERLARAAEYRDDETGQHARRVGHVAALLSHRLGRPPTEVDLIRRAAQLHDIGKIGIPDQVLLKRGRFTPEERACMRTHSRIGAGIVSGSASPLLQLAEEVALTHHERWDGAGNITAVAGSEIPLSGRIVAVADVLDALTHERPYKPAWPLAEALREIGGERGRQFDPCMVDALDALVSMGELCSPTSSAPLRVH